MMPGPKPAEIILTDGERQELEKLVRRHTTGQQKALRGRIALLAADGQNTPEIAKELKTSLDTEGLWRRRWLDLQPISWNILSVEERLEDLPRPGAPPRLTADQICQIEQMACEKPKKSGRPIIPKHASWTNQVEIWFSILVRKLLKRGNFTSIEDLEAKVLAFIEYFNQTMAKPFKWTYQGKALTA